MLKTNGISLKKFPRNINPEYKIITCDIKSLYTSIPIDLGLKAIEYWLNKRSDLIPERFSKIFIMELLSFVLQNNYFLFDMTLFIQLIGTFMGASFAPIMLVSRLDFWKKPYYFQFYCRQYLTLNCVLSLRCLFFVSWMME